MSTAFDFSAPENAASRLKTLDGGNLLSFIRQLPWSFLQSLMGSSADFDSTDLCRRVLEALPSDFDDMFDEVTDKTGAAELINIVRTVYCHESNGERGTDQIIGDCVRNWTSRVTDELGLTSVAQVIDPVFIQENTFTRVRRLGYCLDAIGVCPFDDQTLRFADRKARKHQVVSRPFDFWKSRVPISSVSGFIGRVFAESSDGRKTLFCKHWSREAVEDLEPFEARELSTFLHPDEAVSPSGAAGRRALLTILSSGSTDVGDAPDDITAADQSVIRFPTENPAQINTENKGPDSLADLHDMEDNIPTAGRPKRKSNKKKNKRKNHGRSKEKKGDYDDDSSDESSDDEHISEEGSDDDGFAKHCGLSPKFRHIIRHQGGAEFAGFFKPHALQIATKADLYEVLGHFRAGMQCANALCRVNNLAISHQATPESFQSKQIPIVLPELRAQPHLAFPMTQRVAPGAIRQFLQAGSIVTYTHALAEKAGSVSKDSADGYLAREIMNTGLALASIFDECHPYHTIFLNIVERLVRRLLVHEGALALEKKDRGAFYEKNLAFMGLAAAASGKSLKHLS